MENAPVINHSTLIDHHCHGITLDTLEREDLEALMSEAHRPHIKNCSQFDKPLGLIIKRFCAPILDLEPHCTNEEYIDQRIKLGGKEASKRLMEAAQVTGMLIDTGHRSDDILGVKDMAEISNCFAHEVVRIESVMEGAARQAGSVDQFLDHFKTDLYKRAEGAIALKSIVAYRATFNIAQSRPTLDEVKTAASHYLKKIEDEGWQRLEDSVLIRHALFIALDICAEKNFPLQLHVGVGDLDVDMPNCDPTVFIPFIKEAERVDVPLTLLHCYPFIRESTWLAEVFSNVYFDVGFTLNFTGPMAQRVMEDALEMGPFFKQLYSSDAFGLAELHYLGRIQFQRMIERVLGNWITNDDCSLKEADDIVAMISHKNCQRIYHLD